MKSDCWHFARQMVFAFLALAPLHLFAQDYYHQLNVRIVNNSGVTMSAYVDIEGLDNGYSSKNCFMGMHNLPNGREFATRCNSFRSPHQVLETIAFHGVVNCYPAQGGYQGSVYRFPEDRSQSYLNGPRGNAPVNLQGEYVLTFEYGSLPCEVDQASEDSSHGGAQGTRDGPTSWEPYKKGKKGKEEEEKKKLPWSKGGG